MDALGREPGDESLARHRRLGRRLPLRGRAARRDLRLLPRARLPPDAPEGGRRRPRLQRVRLRQRRRPERMTGKLRSLILPSALTAACVGEWLGASGRRGVDARAFAEGVGRSAAVAHVSSAGEALSRSAPGVKTDRGVYAKPPLPALPPAGGTYRDPVFGTEV